MSDELKWYVCVDKHQKQIDPHHADWRYIEAKNKYQARFIYSSLANTKYIDVSCCLKSRFKKLY